MHLCMQSRARRRRGGAISGDGSSISQDPPERFINLSISSKMQTVVIVGTRAQKLSRVYAAQLENQYRLPYVFVCEYEFEF